MPKNIRDKLIDFIQITWGYVFLSSLIKLISVTICNWLGINQLPLLIVLSLIFLFIKVGPDGQTKYIFAFSVSLKNFANNDL